MADTKTSRASRECKDLPYSIKPVAQTRGRRPVALPAVGYVLAAIGAPYPPVSSRRTIAAPSANALSLAKARERGMYFMPQSGAGISAPAAGAGVLHGCGRRRSAASPA